MADPSMAQRWTAFVHAWAKYHGVDMTDKALDALCRAIPPPELVLPGPAPATLVDPSEISGDLAARPVPVPQKVHQVSPALQEQTSFF